ncbi:MAG: LacI family DNA-binding transcriptional regulator [Flammeovirgaceae bacterium]
MAVTIKDIAEELGLSPSTVSRALRDDTTISKETQERVKSLAKKWKYEPNPFAMMLRGQRSKALVVIVPRLDHFYFSSVINGIERYAQSLGYQIIVCQTDDLYQKEKAILESPFLGYANGIIAAFAKDTNKFDHFDRFLQKGIPVVFFDRVCEELEVPSVITDDYSGVWEATQHLVLGGRNKVAYLGVGDPLLFNEVREMAFLESLGTLHIDCPRQWLRSCIDGSVESGKAEALKLLNQPINERPNAILANNDLLALGAMQAAADLNISIPRDLAIVGFGDLPFSQWLTPSLSSVKQNGENLGRLAANYLFQEIESIDESPSEGSIIKTELVIRNSSRLSS